MATPKFVSIVAGHVSSASGGNAFYAGNVHGRLYGLTAEGEVYEWDADSKRWIRLQDAHA